MKAEPTGWEAEPRIDQEKQPVVIHTAGRFST
jgi:hypothetical protein